MSLTRKQQFGFDFESKNIQNHFGLGKSRYDSLEEYFQKPGDSIEARLIEKSGEDGLTSMQATAIARRMMILHPDWKMHSFRTRNESIIVRRRKEDEVPSKDEENLEEEQPETIQSEDRADQA